MRAFSLLECMAAVVLLAMAAATVVVQVSPSIESAQVDDARSIVLDADARARVLAARGAVTTLELNNGLVTIRVGNDDAPAVGRWLPVGVTVSLLTSDTHEAVTALPVDRLGRSSDYIISVDAAGARSQTRIAGLTGYAFPEEVSER